MTSEYQFPLPQYSWLFAEPVGFVLLTRDGFLAPCKTMTTTDGKGPAALYIEDVILRTRASFQRPFTDYYVNFAGLYTKPVPNGGTEPLFYVEGIEDGLYKGLPVLVVHVDLETFEPPLDWIPLYAGVLVP